MEMTIERKAALSNILRPVASPREIDNVYTDNQHERLLGTHTPQSSSTQSVEGKRPMSKKRKAVLPS